MDHVAALAKGLEVLRRVVARIVVGMRSRQHDLRHADRKAVAHDEAGQSPAASADPLAARRVPPCAVAEMLDTLSVRPAALLAPAARPLEPDRG